MSACDNPFLIYKIVLASIKTDEAIQNITQPNEVFRMDLTIKSEGFLFVFAKNFEAFSEALDQQKCAGYQLQYVSYQNSFVFQQRVLALKNAPDSTFGLNQGLDFHN